MAGDVGTGNRETNMSFEICKLLLFLSRFLLVSSFALAPVAHDVEEGFTLEYQILSKLSAVSHNGVPFLYYGLASS